jgi:hypothetical protein
MTGSMTRLAEVSRQRRSLEPDDVQLVGLDGQVDVAQHPPQIAAFQPATFTPPLVSFLHKSGGPY